MALGAELATSAILAALLYSELTDVERVHHTVRVGRIEVVPGGQTLGPAKNAPVCGFVGATSRHLIARSREFGPIDRSHRSQSPRHPPRRPWQGPKN
jgi:hypothetical protein